MKNILQHFNKIKDNRSNQGKRYKLGSILALVSIGYMAGCDSLLKTHIFWQRMTKTNRQRLGFTNSMPSHPTITQTLKRIDPEEFEAVLSEHYSNNNLEIDSYEYTFKGHGRIESRKIEAIESHRRWLGYEYYQTSSYYHQ